eukprot:4666137-Amphidinium_carterae.1
MQRHDKLAKPVGNHSGSSGKFSVCEATRSVNRLLQHFSFLLTEHHTFDVEAFLFASSTQPGPRLGMASSLATVLEARSNA